MKVLFICLENTCRSQMAEGFARAAGIDADSAGVHAGDGVNPLAVQVMQELGIDISKQKPKVMNPSTFGQYNAIISMCSVNASDVCPATFLGIKANWNIDDPKGKPVEEFRCIADEIQKKVQDLALT